MPHLVNVKKFPGCFDKTTGWFKFSEKDFPFATEYELKNPETGKSEIFKFIRSTGPEFDPNTKWIYMSTTSDLMMSVANDAATTARAANDYLNAKLRR